MEEKKKLKKLVLKKEMISTLNGPNMKYIIGGSDDTLFGYINTDDCVTQNNCINDTLY